MKSNTVRHRSGWPNAHLLRTLYLLNGVEHLAAYLRLSY